MVRVRLTFIIYKIDIIDRLFKVSRTI